MGKNENILKIFQASAIISAGFMVLVTILLALSWYQLETQRPLEILEQHALKTELKSQPANQELKETFRELHLLARKAHFNNVEFINIGAILLLIGGIVFLISVKAIFVLNPTKLTLEKCKGMTQRPERSPLRIAFAIFIIFIFIAGLGLAYITKQELKNPTLTVVEMPLEKETPVIVEKDLWSSFRGPNGWQTSVDYSLPTNWHGVTAVGVKWQVPIELPGFNSPVIAGDHIYLSGANKTIKQIYCYSLKSGELLWQYDAKMDPTIITKLQEVGADTGYAAPTLTTDGQRVCAIFADGSCYCLDANGKELWTVSIGVPNIAYGYASSPLIYKNSLIIQYDTEDKGAVMSLKLSDGSTAWQTLRAYDSSWSSPIIVDDKVILNALPMITAYDLSNGKLAWETECLGGEVAPGSTYSSGIVLSANEYSTLTAIDFKAGTNIWQAYDNLPEVASLLAISNRLYMASSGGVVSCLDIFTGEMHWSWEGDNGFYSSPVAAGGYIYATDMRGDTFIFEDSNQLKQVAKNSMGEAVVSTFAFAPGNIIIRTTKNLYCIAND